MENSIDKSQVIDFRVRVPPALAPQVETPEANATQYDAVLDIASKVTVQTAEDLLAEMDAAGVDHAIMHAEYEHHDQADAQNRAVADCVETCPSRFTGIGTISMESFSIPRALKQIDQCVEYGLVGLSVQPAFFGMTITDKELYPVYAKALENDLIVALHTGINYTTDRPMSGENPVLLDDIACAFPGLKLVASHGGWPFIHEMVAVARKHPNVFIEFGGLAPKYVGAPGSGWEVMRRFMDSVLSDQILFASDWPVMNQTRIIEEWKTLGLKETTLDKLMLGNARTLLQR